MNIINTFKSFVKKYKTVLLIIIWIAIYVSAFLFLSSGIKNESIWVDESHTSFLIKNSIIDIIKIASKDYHPPLYFILLKFFSMPFGHDLITIRYFSVLGTIALISLGAGPIRKIFGNKGGIIFSLLVIILPVFSSVSQDARMYSWACFFVTGSAIYTSLITKEIKVTRWVLFGVFTLSSAYIHHYALIGVTFLNIFIFIYFLITNKKKLAIYIITALILILLFLPWAYSLILQIKKTSNEFWIPEIHPFLIIQSMSYLFQNKFTSFDYSGSLIGLAFILLFAIFSCKFCIIEKKKTAFLIFISLFTYIFSLLFIIIFSIMIKPILYPRYFLNISGLLIIIIAFTISRIKKLKFTLFILSILIIISIPQNIYIRRNRINGPMKEAAYFVNQNLTKDDIFVYSEDHTMGTFIYHFPDNKHYLYLSAGSNGYFNYETFGKNLTVLRNFENLDFSNKNIWIVNLVHPTYRFTKDLIYNYELEPLNINGTFVIPSSWYSIHINKYKVVDYFSNEDIISKKEISFYD